MIAIGLTCAIYVACLVAAGFLALPLRIVRSHGYGDARRTLLAIQRAANSGLTRSLRVLVVVVGVLLSIWAGVSTLVLPNATIRGAATQIAYSLVAGAAGASVTALLAFGAIRWARSAAMRAVVAAHLTSDRLLLTILRSSLLVTLGVEALGFGICISIFGIAWLSSQNTDATATVLSNAVGILTGFAVGALLASYVIQTTGAAYRTSATVGSATATEEGELSEADPRNPAAIAEAAGVQLGQLIPQILDAFCSALCANLLVALLCMLSVRTAPHLAAHQTYLCIPLVMRAFATLSLVFATGGARTLETVSPSGALLRSQVVATAISTGAVWGSCYWLMPDISVRMGICGTLGLVAPLAIGHWQRLILNRKLRPNSNSRLSNDNPWSNGLVLGMWMVLGPLFALGALFGTAQFIGSTLPIEHGPLLATGVSLLAMNMAVPIVTSAHAATTAIFLAKRAAFLLLRRRDDASRRRLSRLDDSIRDGTAWATSVQTSYGTAIPLVASLILGSWSKSGQSMTFGNEALAAIVTCTIALLLPFALRLRTSSRASHAVAAEVRRQLNGVRQDTDGSALPGNFTPSYRSCVDIAARESTRQLFVSAAVTSAPGLTLGLGLVWLTKSPGLVGQALAMYLGQAAIAALVAGVVLEIAIEFASASRIRTSRSATLPDIATGNCAIQYLAICSSSAASILAKTSVLAAITFVPYLF